MRFKLKRKTVDIKLKALFINEFFWWRLTGSRGASPSHLLRKSPIICPSCSAEANRTRRTDGFIPFEKVKQNKKAEKRKFISLSWWRRTGSRGQAPRICFANPRLYVPRAPSRRTARDGLTVRSLLKRKNKIKKQRNENSFLCSGGDGRDRTVDLLNAIQALSQLSYAPVQYIVYLMNYIKEPFTCQQLFAIF